jgi:hypothetical protein
LILLKTKESKIALNLNTNSLHRSKKEYQQKMTTKLEKNTNKMFKEMLLLILEINCYHLLETRKSLNKFTLESINNHLKKKLDNFMLLFTNFENARDPLFILIKTNFYKYGILRISIQSIIKISKH